MLLAAITDSVTGYGLAGLIVTSVMAVIVGPLIKSTIAQSRRAMDLMEKSIEQNTRVVSHLKDMEAGSLRSRQALAETQTEILASLRGLEKALARRDDR